MDHLSPSNDARKTKEIPFPTSTQSNATFYSALLSSSAHNGSWQKDNDMGFD
jgi:hypothetical protein